MSRKTTRTMRSDIKRIKKEYPQVRTLRGNGGGVIWDEKEEK